MAEARLLRVLKLKLTDEQANKLTEGELKFLLDNAFDDHLATFVLWRPDEGRRRGIVDNDDLSLYKGRT